jgi:hypothetical protein
MHTPPSYLTTQGLNTVHIRPLGHVRADRQIYAEGTRNSLTQYSCGSRDTMFCLKLWLEIMQLRPNEAKQLLSLVRT